MNSDGMPSFDKLRIFPRLGVDLVEIQKAKDFYRAHRDRLKDWLAPEEISYIRESRKPYESLAVLLAAKEAVFKALSRPWMGPFGFGDIQIVPGKNKVSCRFRGPFEPFDGKKRFTLSFYKDKRYVVALCAGI